MAIEHIFGVRWSGGSAPAVSVDPTLSGDTAIEAEVPLGAGTVTNQEQQVGFDVANLKGVCITVENNPATTVVLTTNNSGTPVHTFTFPAGGGELFWNGRTPAEHANPFGSTDVTTMFFTKSGADTPTVHIRILLNA